MAVVVRWPTVPVIWAETSSPTLTPPVPRAVPVMVVALVTAAVTEGPSPPMAIDVPLTARTRPVRTIRSCPFPLPDSPDGPDNPGSPVPLPAGADTLGVVPSAACTWHSVAPGCRPADPGAGQPRQLGGAAGAADRGDGQGPPVDPPGHPGLMLRQVPVVGLDHLVDRDRAPRSDGVRLDRRRLLQQRLGDLPQSLDRVGSGEQRLVADHGLQDQVLVALERIRLDERVLVLDRHRGVAQAQPRAGNLGQELGGDRARV